MISYFLDIVLFFLKLIILILNNLLNLLFLILYWLGKIFIVIYIFKFIFYFYDFLIHSIIYHWLFVDCLSSYHYHEVFYLPVVFIQFGFLKWCFYILMSIFPILVASFMMLLIDLLFLRYRLVFSQVDYQSPKCSLVITILEASLIMWVPDYRLLFGFIFLLLCFSNLLTNNKLNSFSSCFLWPSCSFASASCWIWLSYS